MYTVYLTWSTQLLISIERKIIFLQKFFQKQIQLAACISQGEEGQLPPSSEIWNYASGPLKYLKRSEKIEKCAILVLKSTPKRLCRDTGISWSPMMPRDWRQLGSYDAERRWSVIQLWRTMIFTFHTYPLDKESAWFRIPLWRGIFLPFSI